MNDYPEWESNPRPLEQLASNLTLAKGLVASAPSCSVILKVNMKLVVIFQTIKQLGTTATNSSSGVGLKGLLHQSLYYCCVLELIFIPLSYVLRLVPTNSIITFMYFERL